MDNSISPREIVNWLSKELDDDKLVFDEVVYIQDRIKTMLALNGLELKANNKLFVLKINLF